VRTTPVYSPIRFRAQFFLLETTQEPEIWPGELADGGWWAYAEALRAWERGDLLLAPPTLEAVRALLAHGLQAADVLEGSELGGPWLPLSPGLHYLPLETATLPPARHTLCLLVGGERKLLVDPAGPVPACGVEEVVFTHHHPDHVGGGPWARTQGLRLAAHRETAARLPFPVDRLLAEGDGWDLGTDEAGLPWQVEALHTPGHAPGHLALWEGSRRFLLAGDLISGLSTILIHPPEGDMAAYLESLERMAALRPRLVVAAHGPPFGPESGIFERVLAHRRAREARVLAALGAPRPLDDLLGEVYADTPGAAPELARMALQAHLLKLEREGRAHSGPDGWAAGAAETAQDPPTARPPG
jgi:glyoxylase-like metal-dependent hydrolase (beta-lactamase superfamily II)